MSDATFYLLDALLSAARGMIYTSKAKGLQKEHNLPDDPRSALSRIGTSPLGSAAISFIGALLLRKDMQTNVETALKKRSLA